MSTAYNVIRQKSRGNADSNSVPFWVGGYDTSLTGPQVPIALDEAFTALTDSELVDDSIFDVPDDGNPGWEQTGMAWILTINYRQPGLRQLLPGPRVKFQMVAKPKFLIWAPERAIYHAPSIPAETTLYGIIQPTDLSSGSNEKGASIEPGPENLSRELTVPLADVSGSWVRSIASMLGMVNSGSLTGGAYAAGEIQLVRVVGCQITGSLMHFDFGWSWKQNVADETRDTITGIAYHGHDFVWVAGATVVSPTRVISFLQPNYCVASIVWPEGNLSALGVEPPG